MEETTVETAVMNPFDSVMDSQSTSDSLFSPPLKRNRNALDNSLRIKKKTRPTVLGLTIPNIVDVLPLEIHRTICFFLDLDSLKNVRISCQFFLKIIESHFLILSYAFGYDDADDEIRDFLQLELKDLSRLERLIFKHTIFADARFIIGGLLSHLDSLKCLDFDCVSGFIDEHLALVPRHLQSISLTNIEGITDLGLQKLQIRTNNNILEMQLVCLDAVTDNGLLFLSTRLTGLTLHEMVSITDVGMQRIPSTLVRLMLCNMDVTDFGTSPSFTRLQSLEAKKLSKLTDRGLAALPYSLTSLCLSDSPSITDDGLATHAGHLREITVLKCREIGKSTIQMASQLFVLSLNCVNLTSGCQFSSNLTSLGVHSGSRSLDDNILLLPKTLKKLSVGHNTDFKSISKNLLPDHLVKLSVTTLNVSLENASPLPLTLRTFVVKIFCLPSRFVDLVKILPNELTRLEIHDAIDETIDCSTLPRCLLRLEINCRFIPSTLKFLPPALYQATISLPFFTEFESLPDIQILSLHKVRYIHYASLPDTIEELSINCDNDENVGDNLKTLPHSIRHLKLSQGKSIKIEHLMSIPTTVQKLTICDTSPHRTSLTSEDVQALSSRFDFHYEPISNKKH